MYTQLHSIRPVLITVIPQLTKWSSHCQQEPLHRNGGTDCSTVGVVSPATPPISHSPHLSPPTYHTSHLPPTHHATHLPPTTPPIPHTTDLTLANNVLPFLAIMFFSFQFGNHGDQCSFGDASPHTRGTLNFGRHPPMQFVVSCAQNYLTSADMETRMEAVKTCTALLVPMLQQVGLLGPPIL